MNIPRVGPALAAGFLMAATLLVSAAPQQATTRPFMPVSAVQPGMIATGRTVFAGTTLEDFQARIIATLTNVSAPGRSLILAKLSGGPIAEAGVIAGMSGSPVYIDGKLIGAVSYSIGQFPREALAGITPIEEMLADVDGPHSVTRPSTANLGLGPNPTPEAVFAALTRVMTRSTTPPLTVPAATAAAAGLGAATLTPINLAMSLRGFDAALAAPLAHSIGASPDQAPTAAGQRPAAAPLRPGDPVGASLLRGDFEMGATGTVTWVDGTRVYAFGHPFLGMGPTSMAMTRARVYTVLPSLANSMKIADLGPVIGVVSQDRATAIGGDMGAPLRELAVRLQLVNGADTPRHFNFYIAQDPAMTPLFAYVSMLNVLTSYQRQTGIMTIGIQGTASFGTDGAITIDDLYTGDQALAGVANSVLGPLSAMMGNDFGTARPETLDLTLNVSEQQASATIERAWLDTARPKYGATHTLHVQLRNYRGTSETIDVPVTMPTSGPAAVTLLVCDAPTLAGIEDKELDPNAAKTIPELVSGLNRIRRNNRLYVRLLTAAPGTVIAGRAQPALPGSTRSVLDADKSAGVTGINRTFVGGSEQRLNRVVRGSREIALTLSAEIK